MTILYGIWNMISIVIRMIFKIFNQFRILENGDDGIICRNFIPKHVSFASDNNQIIKKI